MDIYLSEEDIRTITIINSLSEEEITALFDWGIFNDCVIIHLKKALESVDVSLDTEEEIINAVKNSLVKNKVEEIM